MCKSLLLRVALLMLVLKYCRYFADWKCLASDMWTCFLPSAFVCVAMSMNA